MTKNALAITGSAPCVLMDIAALPRVCAYDFMAIGMDAVHLYMWPILYVATFHPADIPEIYRRRAAICGNTDFRIISQEQRDDVHIHIPNGEWWTPSGSSALLGVQAAIQRLGYERIVLCGCPLRGKNHAGNDYNLDFSRGWIARRAELGGKVRSMSGWTQEFLGGPTEEWLLASAAPQDVVVALDAGAGADTTCCGDPPREASR